MIMVPGIDVSHYNGVIDWHKVAQSGVKFAYIKCTDGATFHDPMFVKNREGARWAGLKVGSYHFLRPGVGAGQLNGFLSQICGATDDLPPCLDVEIPSESLPVIECAQRIADELKRIPVIYTNAATATKLVDPLLAAYPLWLALYQSISGNPALVPGDWKVWTFWQHTDKGTVAGIEGNVDLDWFNGDEAEFAHFVETSKTLPT
jgi:lysozyme